MVDEIDEDIIEDEDESLEISSHDFELGYVFGEYDAEKIARKAYDMGEIDLWIAWSKPKTIEEWEKWEAENGEYFEERWKE